MTKQQFSKIILLILMSGWFITAVFFYAAFRTHLPLLIFLISTALERFIETFYTSKQNILRTGSKFDWNFLLITFSYIVLMYAVIMEIFHSNFRTSWAVSFMGAVIFGFALVLRWWAITSLGFKWNPSLSKRRLGRHTKIRFIRRGPYRYFRHPMYLGTIGEIAGITLLCNAYISLIFAAIVCIPLVIARALTEESILQQRFGSTYRNYKNKTGFLLPKSKNNS